MSDVWVCESGKQASCWAGIFMCWESSTAGVVRQSKEECARLNHENSYYYILPEVQVAPGDTRTRL